MKSKVKDFLAEKSQSLAEQARTMREAPVEAARGAATRSAERLKSLRTPVREVARSGVRLTAISHGMLQGLIELQEQIVTSALSDAAQQLEGAARTEKVMDIVRNQADVLRSTRERIISDMTRAVSILTEAGRGAREVATDTYSKVRKPASAGAAKAKRQSARRLRAAARQKPRPRPRRRPGADARDRLRLLMRERRRPQGQRRPQDSRRVRGVTFEPWHWNWNGSTRCSVAC